jgi:minor capsid protein 10
MDKAIALNSGSKNGSFSGLEANDRELLVEKVTGEILSSFEKNVAMEGKYQRKEINGAKSLRFEHIGGIGAYYHNAGEHIKGSEVAHDKSELTLDRPLVSSFFTDDFNESMLHYDARKEYTKKMGEVLAQKYDRNIQMKFITAARLKNVMDEYDGGSVIVDTNLANADLATRVNAFAKALIAAKKELIKKNVTGEIFAVTSPDTYFEIIENRALLNKDYGNVGDYAEGTVFKIGGIPLTYHNYLPNVDATKSANKEFYDEYHGINCEGTIAFVGTNEAVGVLKGGDITTKIWDDDGRMGTWTRASLACGMGVLRPECAVEIRKAALPANWAQVIHDKNRVGAGKLPTGSFA